MAIVPSGRRATTSVNVPPRSIQNCQRPGVFVLMGGGSSGGANVASRYAGVNRIDNGLPRSLP